MHNWGSLMSTVMPSYLKYNLSHEDIYLHVKISVWLRMISEQRQDKALLMVGVPPKGTQQDPLSRIESVRFLCCVPVRTHSSYVHLLIGCNSVMLGWGSQKVSRIQALCRCCGKERRCQNGRTLLNWTWRTVFLAPCGLVQVEPQCSILTKS